MHAENKTANNNSAKALLTVVQQLLCNQCLLCWKNCHRWKVSCCKCKNCSIKIFSRPKTTHDKAIISYKAEQTPRELITENATRQAERKSLTTYFAHDDKGW